MMREAILNFPKQFLFNPRIDPVCNTKNFNNFVACGIGGSLLAANLVKSLNPELPLVTHPDYGLPFIPKNKQSKTLTIFVSYSGNTEEPLDGFNCAGQLKYQRLAISINGKLHELAEEYKVPRIIIPNTGIQPRMALGFNYRAILKAMGEDQLIKQSNSLLRLLNPEALEPVGKELAQTLHEYVPVIYSSFRNQIIAYSWKIKLNETGKIPAFYNILPEMNHNEMTGFDAVGSTRALSKKYFFIFLLDDDDNERIQTRMEVLEKLYKDRKFPVKIIKLQGDSHLQKVFSSLLLADWTAYYLAQSYGVEAEQVPMVEKFKKLIE
ncbi:MAG: SIS domain-containing protein [Patescibacteria group bacterium]